MVDECERDARERWIKWIQLEENGENGREKEGVKLRTLEHFEIKRAAALQIIPWG